MRRPDVHVPALLLKVFPWPLLDLGQRWASVLVSGALLGGVLLSRLAFLPDGPWEQDEALLASGVVDFNPAQHMPLPPGFPLWIAIGRLVRFLGVSDPVVALQIACSVFSLVAFWALIGLWEDLSGRGLAVTAALLASFLPGTWFHAHRAFSETPSAALTIVALACWRHGGRRGLVPGVIAATCAALVRPPLAPFFVVLVMLALWPVRRDLRLLGRAALAGLATLAVVLVPAAIEAGGLDLLLDVTMTHASEHTYLLGGEAPTPLRLGFTRGLPGPTSAAIFAILATVGWLSLRRRMGRLWWPGTLAGGWLAYLLVYLHNPTYTRYWVLAWLLMAAPAVLGVRFLLRSPRLAGLLALGAAALAAAWTWPAIAYAHAQPLPVVGALRTVAAESRGTLVFEDQLFSFRNLGRLVGWLRVPSLRLSEMQRAHLGFGAAPIWFLAEGTGADISSTTSQASELSCWVPAIHRLAQERFLQVRLVRNPVLVWRGGSYIEWEGTERYMWCARRSTLILPAVSEAGWVAFAAEVHHEIEHATLVGRVNDDEVFRRELSTGRQVIRIPIPRPLDSRRPVKVDLDLGREIRPITDPRPIAIRFFRASLEAPPHAAPPIVFLPEPASLLAAMSTAEGFYPPEIMGSPPRAAAWTGPRATVALPVASGVVGLEMMASRPSPAEVEVQVGTATAHLLVGPHAIRVELPVPPELERGGLAHLEIRSTTFVPGPTDQRALGVAVSRVWYLPETTSPGNRS